MSIPISIKAILLSYSLFSDDSGGPWFIKIYSSAKIPLPSLVVPVKNTAKQASIHRISTLLFSCRILN